MVPGPRIFETFPDRLVQRGTILIIQIVALDDPQPYLGAFRQRGWLVKHQPSIPDMCLEPVQVGIVPRRYAPRLDGSYG
jgi:hypothetical protein